MAVVARHNRRTQLSFDSAIDLPETIGARDSNRISNSFGVRPAVTYDRYALYAQQWSSAVFGVVESLLKFLKGRPGQHRARFRLKGGFQFMLEQSHYELEHTFAHL